MTYCTQRALEDEQIRTLEQMISTVTNKIIESNIPITNEEHDIVRCMRNAKEQIYNDKNIKHFRELIIEIHAMRVNAKVIPDRNYL